MTPIRHVYIHIPFCKRKCGYCSFFSLPIDDNSFVSHRKRYLSALRREIHLFHEQYDIQPSTIYFGGGTPSLLTPQDIESILACFDYPDDTEITIEMNPAVIAAPLADYRRLINRVSLGVQSFIDRELMLLGRLHDAQQARNTIHELRQAGFDNISIDLMYGLPGQTMHDIAYNLERVREMKPEHISTYCLSLEPDAPMFGATLPDDDLVTDFYDTLRKGLSDYGQYEISNFAKDGFHSRHNTSYWNGVDYLGLGAGASGFIDSKRYTNREDIQAYIENIEHNYIMPNAIQLYEEELRKEIILLSLRKTVGLNLDEYNERFHHDLLKEKGTEIFRLIRDGYICIIDGHLRLMPKGYFVSNEVINTLL